MNKLRSKSTFSLPKIKELPQQSQEIQSTHQIGNRSKILKQIFRPKWGMVPKCLVKGHEGKQILYICINPNCSQTTRLICEECFYSNHQKHNCECLAVDEIKSANIQKLRYWPFRQQFKKMFEFITKHQSYVNNVVQDVNATFNEMAVRIVNAIDKIRLNMLKKIDNFYIKQTNKKIFANKLKVQLQQSFDLKKIQKTVSDLFNKKIKHSVFEQKMNQLLNNKQTLNKQLQLLQFFEKSDKGIDIEFDKQLFLKKQQQLLKGIQDQQISLKQVQVVIGDQKQMKKIIPQALRYLQTAIIGFKDLKFEKKILEDSSQYVGFLYKGVKCVIGMRKYKSGFFYYGQWSNDTRNGWGILQSRKIGYKYIGNWKQDRKHGFGRQQSLTTIYEGQFNQDKKQGFGVFIKDGNRYEITWKNDKMHGQGKMITTDGTECPIYYFNGNQTKTKNQKVNGAMNLTQLTKRFTKSTNSKSIISQTKSS